MNVGYYYQQSGKIKLLLENVNVRSGFVLTSTAISGFIFVNFKSKSGSSFTQIRRADWNQKM